MQRQCMRRLISQRSWSGLPLTDILSGPRTLPLAELAAELGTNRTTLSSYINSSLGTTFYDYVNSSRLEYTEKLLSDPDAKYSVEQLAELSGFNSLSTFRRAFGKKYGMSPQQYRERVLERR